MMQDEATFTPPLPPPRKKVGAATWPATNADGEKDPRIEGVMGRVMSQIGTMIAARFEAIEDRLLPERPLRPPLKADRVAAREKAADKAGAGPAVAGEPQPVKPKKLGGRKTVPPPSGTAVPSRTPANDPPSRGKKEGGKKAEKSTKRVEKDKGVQNRRPSSTPTPAPAPLPGDQTWAEVVRKKKGGKKKEEVTRGDRQQERPAARTPAARGQPGSGKAGPQKGQPQPRRRQEERSALRGLPRW